MSLTRSRLIKEARRALPGSDPKLDAAAQQIVDAFAVVTESSGGNGWGNTQRVDPGVIEYFTLSKPSRTTTSFKPGNILFNWKKLFSETPGLVLTAVGVAVPWVAAVAALYLVKVAWDLSTIDISDDHASAVYALWEDETRMRYLPEEDARGIVNRYRERHSMPALDVGQFAKLLDELVSLRSVYLAEGKVRLVEEVRVKN